MKHLKNLENLLKPVFYRARQFPYGCCVALDDDYLRLLRLYNTAIKQIEELEAIKFPDPPPQKSTSICPTCNATEVAGLRESIKKLTREHHNRVVERDIFYSILREEIGLNFRAKTHGLYRDGSERCYAPYIPQTPGEPYKSPSTVSHTYPLPPIQNTPINPTNPTNPSEVDFL